MAQVNLPSVDGLATLDQVKNALGIVNKNLTWLLQNLDTRNINELNAEVIVAGSIVTDKLAAGSITTEKLDAGAVTAEKITVEELSAISADLGTITAGLIQSIQIFGSYIATRNGSFPRAEINNTGDLLAVYTDDNNSMTIEPGITNTPNLVFTEGGSQVGILGPNFGIVGFQANEPMVISTSSGGLSLNGGSGVLDNVSVPSWVKFRNATSGLSLQFELDAIWTALAGKADVSHTHSVTIPNHNHGNVANTTSGGGTFTVS